MESFKLCEVKTGYVWNIGKGTELKNKFLGTDMLDICKPLKTVFSLFEKLLRQGYTMGFNNYYNSPKLPDFLNELENRCSKHNNI
jgi:hypothetical protein